MKQKKEDALRKDLAEQDEILKMIEESHTECSKLLAQLKEECSNIIRYGPNKIREQEQEKIR